MWVHFPSWFPSHSLRPLFYVAFSFSQSLKPFPSLSSDYDLVFYFKEKNRSNTVKAVSLSSHQLTPTSLLATVSTWTLLLLWATPIQALHPIPSPSQWFCFWQGLIISLFFHSSVFLSTPSFPVAQKRAVHSTILKTCPNVCITQNHISLLAFMVEFLKSW